MKHLLEHFKALSLHPKNAEELKGLILQLAVQGKLTSNWRLDKPEQEPVAKLLGKMEKGRKALVENEVPFTLASTWSWCKFIEVAALRHGHQFRKHDFVEDGIPVVKIGQCKSDGTLDFSKCNFIEKNREDEFNDYLIFKGHLLMALTGGTLGKVTRVDKDYGTVVQNYRVGNFFTKPEILSLDFLNVILESELFQGLVRERINQNAQPNIGKDNIEKILMPIPPLEEQKAIVQIVNTLFAEVEQLEALTKERIQLKEDFATSALKRLSEMPASGVQTHGRASQQDINGEWAFLKEHFATFFTELPNIKKLRESILQLAVQGKLTTHWRKENPNTEDASILLERIKAEKAQLVKEKKIKKEKPLPDITADEIPYDLPDGWVWCRFQDVIKDIEAGKSPKCYPEIAELNQWGVIKMSAISWGEFNELENKALPMEIEPFADKEIKPGDFILTRANTDELIAKSVVVQNGIRTKLLLNDKTLRFKFASNIMSTFINLYNNGTVARRHYKRVSSGTSDSMRNISRENIKILVVPIPPFKEQKVIVEKVNALMALCDQLKQEIQSGQSTLEDWMKSSLWEVFAGD